MAVCRSLAASAARRGRDRHNGPTCLYRGQEATLDMAKKYAVLRLKKQKPEGGFAEAFELGFVDLGCWGDQYFDAGGYPYPDEVSCLRARLAGPQHRLRRRHAQDGQGLGSRQRTSYGG